jgi:two-component system sensor histidine kinase PilS (NtrC family)
MERAHSIAAGKDATHERRDRFRRLILLRLLIATVLLGAGLLILGGGSSAPLFPFAVILVGSILVTPLFWVAQGSGASSSFLVAALTTMDIVLETVIVHHTGGALSQFALLYLLSIASASAFYQMRGTLAFATLAAGAYLSLVAAHAAGLLATPAAVAAPHAAGWLGRLHVLLTVTSFYLIAFLSGQLSVRVERKQRLLQSAAEELRAARLDTDKILQSLASGLVTLDAEGRIVHANRAAEQILGLRPGSAVGAFPREAFGRSGLGLAETLERSLRDREPLHRAEIAAIRGDGTEFPLGLSTSLLRRSEPDGEVRGVIAIFQDLTETRRLEEKLRRADRMATIGELSAGIAHEIRNPLASISGAAEILGSELKVAGEDERLLRLVVREADRLNRFVGEFLAFARSRPRRVSLVPLERLLDDVKSLVESHPKFPRGIAIELALERGEHFIEADGEEIKRVFLNVAQNAVEAMGPTGRLTIGVRRPDAAGDAADDAVEIVFRDTGPGVEESNIAEMFKPFVTWKKGGTGLGLAIAQRIVEEHGGEIRCESTPGHGANFVIRLPGVVVPEEAIAAGGRP